jgi:hypothetical protein
MSPEIVGRRDAETVKLLKPPEAAQRLSISERKLWGLTVPRGPLRCVRIGRSVRYSPADLAEYVENHARR